MTFNQVYDDDWVCDAGTVVDRAGLLVVRGVEAGELTCTYRSTLVMVGTLLMLLTLALLLGVPAWRRRRQVVEAASG